MVPFKPSASLSGKSYGGCPILRALREGWDSEYIRSRKPELEVIRPVKPFVIPTEVEGATFPD